MFGLQGILATVPSLHLATYATLSFLLITRPCLAQTYTSCNPTEGSCPPDPALGKSVSVAFTSGGSSSNFDTQGAVTYDSTNGAAFTISGPGDAPLITSKWYIMFGKYEVTMKVAPGAGIVSSIVLQSDDLDEIDWELLGATPNQGQTNYFGKGQTTTFDRVGYSDISDSTGDWHTYGVEWTAQQIVWSIDGQTARVLDYDQANGQFPQTPCVLKLGAWAGGDPSNAPGTISWAHGPTDYGDGPFTMYVQSVSVTDYSTGTEYEYSNESGDWQSIEAVGGKIGGTGDAPAATGAQSSYVPGVTASAATGVMPWSGESSPTTTYSSYSGLPSGWSVNPTTGMVIPPSAATIVDVPCRVLLTAVSVAVSILALGIWL